MCYLTLQHSIVATFWFIETHQYKEYYFRCKINECLPGSENSHNSSNRLHIVHDRKYTMLDESKHDWFKLD